MNEFALIGRVKLFDYNKKVLILKCKKPMKNGMIEIPINVNEKSQIMINFLKKNLTIDKLVSVTCFIDITSKNCVELVAKSFKFLTSKTEL